MHNGLQGDKVKFTDRMTAHYRDINRENARRFNWEADFVLVHDPQPAALIEDLRPQAKHWVWRCHIDASRPHRAVWKYLREIRRSNMTPRFFPCPASPKISPILSTSSIRPLIPFSDKNRDLTEEEVQAVLHQLGILRDRPIILQVSRFDSFKDPMGVIQAFRLVRRHTSCQLVLVGGEATDDPEGPEILAQVQEAAPVIRISRSCCCLRTAIMKSTPCSAPPMSSCKNPSGKASA